jgi:hypothetical protein
LTICDIGKTWMGEADSGGSPRHRQLFDPQRCRVILFDQRG